VTLRAAEPGETGGTWKEEATTGELEGDAADAGEADEGGEAAASFCV
jgi:hypothetical protein